MTGSLAPFVAEKSKILEAAGIISADAEVELILCYVLNCSRLELFLHGSDRLTDDVLRRFDDILSRRVTRYPLQYILGESWFYGRKFHVNEAVMVPTPETELLCEAAISFVQRRKLTEPAILDIGVGSGVISVTLAHELPEAKIVALDISSEAIAIAQGNAQVSGVAGRIEFRQSDFFSSVKPEECFDLVVSNPPYIAEKDYTGLMPEVLEDPKISLVSGPEGMDAIRILLRDAPGYLAPGGRIMFEIGYDQSEKVLAATANDSRYTSVSIIKDLADIDRVVILSCGDT